MSAMRSPAADRNKDPILGELRAVLPATGTVLEIASGSGQHAVHFARNLPALRFVPSDPSVDARESIRVLVEEARLPNLEAPRPIDVLSADWPALVGEPVDAIVCINMIHIAPFEALEGLVAGAARLLAPGSPLVLYGPFRFHGSFLAPSNEAFSDDLRRRNPAWGVRDVDDVQNTATSHGFSVGVPIALPANNHVIVLRRTPSAI
jgi:cyclopropane fatty-acyl-phospholipid synthase-like methyltransferase